MTTGRRLVVVSALGALLAAGARLVDPGTPWSTLAVLAAAVAAGELLSLRPTDRAALPLSYAVMLVLLRAGTAPQVVITVAVAEAVAFVVRPAPSMLGRLEVTVTRLAAAAAALGAFHLVLDFAAGADERTVVMLALAAAGVAEIVADDAFGMLWARRPRIATRGRSADLALVASGMLMSVGFRGIGSVEGMGLWGAALFSIPLLAAWYSFERLASIRRTHEQTIAALSLVPELAGLARQGHAERVADLSLRLGRELGLGRVDLEYLRAAALLHHLGHLCLDDPGVRGRPIEPSEVTDKGADILRQTEYLRPAGDLLASDTPSLASQVLRVASAYDELTAGDESFASAAVEALYSGPGYVYDPRVLDALELVIIGPSPVSTIR